MSIFRFVPLRSGAVAALIGLLAAGCSEESGTRPVPGPNEQGFVLGDTAGVRLDLPAGGVYRDALSGMAFVFPEGAAGRLVRGEIVSGPERPWEGGRGLHLSFSGRQPVQARLPHTAGGCELVLCYGPAQGAWADGVRTRWSALPVADTLRAPAGDSLLVWLGVPGPAGGARCQAGSAHWFFEFAPGTAVADTLAAAKARARPLIARWLDALSPATRASCRARMEGDLPPAFYPDGLYYSGFARPCAGGGRAAARIGVGESPSRVRLARQLGYYFTHLLMGDEAFADLEASSPLDPGFGRYQFGRVGLIHDLACFHEHLLTGAIEGAGDPAQPALYFLPARPAPLPATTDVPSLQGYGVLLLHALTRQDSSMVSLTGEAVPLLPVGWDYARLAGGVIAAAGTNVDELRQAIAARLSAEGLGDRLALLAAATGWAYSAAATVTDTSAVPVPGATVRNVILVDGREFASAPQPFTADERGRAQMHPLFPGPSTLRVEMPGDTFAVALRRDWELPTNAPPQALTLVPWRQLDRLNKLRIAFDLAFAPGGSDTLPRATLRATLTMYAGDLVFAGDRITLPGRYAFPCDPGGTKDCWEIDSLRIAYSLLTGEVEELRFRLAEGRHPPTALRLRARPGAHASMLGCNQVFFAKLVQADAVRVGEVLDLSLADALGGAYTAADLVGGANMVQVYAYRG